MPLRHFAISRDLSMRAIMTIEAEINVFNNNFDVRIEELLNEPYFDGTALKIKTFLRIIVSLAEDPESYSVFESLIQGIEPRQGRYPISRYEFDLVESNSRDSISRDLLNEEAPRVFNAAIVYSNAHFFVDQ